MNKQREYTCQSCGVVSAQDGGAGRPRKYCPDCSIPARNGLRAVSAQVGRCRVPKCGKKANEQGLCPKHRRRLQEYGSVAWKWSDCVECGGRFAQMLDLTSGKQERCRRCLSRPCAWCGTIYDRPRVGVQFCSPACANAHKASVEPRTGRACVECGGRFAARETQVFCGRRCQQRHHTRRKHAIRRGAATGDEITFARLRARDGNKCGLCGGRVGSESWPHPMSGSIDHIVPLSKGGLHKWSNVQLAHLGCNSRKGNGSVGSQLLLVG